MATLPLAFYSLTVVRSSLASGVVKVKHIGPISDYRQAVAQARATAAAQASARVPAHVAVYMMDRLNENARVLVALVAIDPAGQVVTMHLQRARKANKGQALLPAARAIAARNEPDA